MERPGSPVVYDLHFSSAPGAVLILKREGTNADLNGDGKVDCADIVIVQASFGKKPGQPGFDARADVNGDGVVGVRDLSFVSQQLPAGTRC